MCKLRLYANLLKLDMCENVICTRVSSFGRGYHRPFVCVTWCYLVFHTKWTHRDHNNTLEFDSFLFIFYTGVLTACGDGLRVKEYINNIVHTQTHTHTHTITRMDTHMHTQVDGHHYVCVCISTCVLWNLNM